MNTLKYGKNEIILLVGKKGKTSPPLGGTYRLLKLTQRTPKENGSCVHAYFHLFDLSVSLKCVNSEREREWKSERDPMPMCRLEN